MRDAGAVGEGRTTARSGALEDAGAAEPAGVNPLTGTALNVTRGSRSPAARNPSALTWTPIVDPSMTPVRTVPESERSNATAPAPSTPVAVSVNAPPSPIGAMTSWYVPVRASGTSMS